MNDKPETKDYDIKLDVDQLNEEEAQPQRSKLRTLPDGSRIYRTAAGVDVDILGISPMLMQKVGDAFRFKYPEPKPPTYVVETAGGGKEVNYHDDTTVETVEEVDALQAYKDEHAAWRAASQAALVRAVVIKGVKFEMPENDAWIEDQELLGLEVPEGELERRIHYFETEVVSSVEDMLTLLGSAMGLGGMQDEMLGTAMSMFRTEIQGTASNS